MHILQVVLNDFRVDARVLRAAELGRELGARVTVFALHEAGLPEHESLRGIEIRRFRLSTRRWPKAKAVQAFKYAEALWRFRRAGVDLQPDIVHANDLTGLPIGDAIARRCGARLIYDAHELWSDPSYASQYVHWLWKIGFLIERRIARRADAVLTVSEGLASEMAGNLGIDHPLVIRNVPSAPRRDLEWGPHPLREKLDIPLDVPLILHQGYVHEGRGLVHLVEAIPLIEDDRAVVVILGSGGYLDTLKAKVGELSLERRVLFHPAVSPDVLPLWTRDADIGICATEDTHLSHKYSLPNKLFEYLQAGLPVVASDLVETTRVIDEFGCGIHFPDGDVEAMAACIDRALGDSGLAEASLEAARQLNWEAEGERLADVYRRLFSKEPAVTVSAT